MPPRTRGPQSRARQAAQRRTARALRAGTFQPSPAALASRRAYARLTGTSARGRMGDSGWIVSEHYTLGGAIRQAQRLPFDNRAMIAARGRMAAEYSPSGQMEWRTLNPAPASPDWFEGQAQQDQLRDAAGYYFAGAPRTYRVMWRAGR